MDTELQEKPPGEEQDEFGPSGSEDFHQQEQPPVEEKPTEEKPPAAGLLTKEDLAEFGKQIGAGFAQTREQTQQQKEMTPEEIDAALQIWKPSEDLFDRLGNPETRVAAFAEMRDGMMKQALTASHHIIQAEIEKIRGELAPVQSFAQEQRAEKLKTQFTTQFPALTKYEKLLPLVTAALERKGFKAKSIEDGFKTLADETAKVIREQFDPNFTLDAKTTNDQTKNSSGRPPMSTSGGRGQQGGAGSGKTGGAQSPDDGLWD